MKWQNMQHLHRQIYVWLYQSNVTSVSTIKVNANGALAAIYVDFETHEEAETARLSFDRTRIFGKPIRVFHWYPPMKYLGGLSWDAGRGGVHYSGRDAGSAAGTNFEQLQEDLYRKAVRNSYLRTYLE